MLRLRTAYASAILSVIVAGGSDCDRSSPSAPSAPVEDRWKTKLEQYRKEYESNEARLKAEWRSALQEADSANLDADRLAVDISDLRRQLVEKRQTLTNWNQELSTSSGDANKRQDHRGSEWPIR